MQTTKHPVLTQQLTVGDYFSQAWKVMLRNASALFTLLALLVLPWAVLAAYYPMPNIFNFGGGKAWTAGLILLFKALGNLFFALSASVIADADLGGSPLTAGAALPRAWARLFDGVTTSLYMVGVLMIALILLVLPSIYLGVLFAFVVPVVALRGERNWSAMKYSRSLVQGQWWRVFGAELIMIGIYVLIMLPFVLMSLFTENSMLAAVTEIVGALPDPLYYCVFTIFFLNAEARRNTAIPGTAEPKDRS